jgi:hypothetical protein
MGLAYTVGSFRCVVSVFTIYSKKREIVLEDTNKGKE